MIRRTILTVLLLVFCGAAAAQKYPERRAIRSGNRQYEKGAYPEAETAYRRALEKTPDSPEATFNLSDALYKQERYDEAASSPPPPRSSWQPTRPGARKPLRHFSIRETRCSSNASCRKPSRLTKIR